ncbi:hypothetical protein KAS50_02890 [bacterium]|nr:hypothetical protein [bacterium]
MAKKERTFASKLSKDNAGEKCPVCNQQLSSVKLIKSVQTEDTGAWKFQENHVKICKCNQKEVMG